MRNMRTAIADLMTKIQIARACEDFSVKEILERNLLQELTKKEKKMEAQGLKREVGSWNAWGYCVWLFNNNTGRWFS